MKVPYLNGIEGGPCDLETKGGFLKNRDVVMAILAVVAFLGAQKLIAEPDSGHYTRMYDLVCALGGGLGCLYLFFTRKG